MNPLLIWGLALLAVALVLVVLEFFIPSAGVISISAGVTALLGLIFLFRYDTVWGLGATLLTLLLIPLIFFGGLRLWRHTPFGRRVIGIPSEEELAREKHAEETQQAQRRSLVGKAGTALTDLRPVGLVRVETQTLEALAENSLIPKGQRVVIVAATGSEVKVRPAT